MEEHEAEKLVSTIEDHWSKKLYNARPMWVKFFMGKEVEPVVRAIQYLAVRARRQPSMGEFSEVISMHARNERQIEPYSMLREPKPEWVTRWERARAAGDTRLFPEQVAGIRQLHREHGSPYGAELKWPGHPSGYEADVAVVEQFLISDREHWIQPDEYVT